MSLLVLLELALFYFIPGVVDIMIGRSSPCASVNRVQFSALAQLHM